MTELLIFPYSGTAIEALDCLGDEWSCIGFVSDDDALIGSTQLGIPVYGRDAIESKRNCFVLAVHGSPTSYKKREEILRGLQVSEERLATVVHPRASVGRHVQLGKNVLIMAGAVITANAKIGDHCIILPNSVIHHDSCIGDYTLVAANVTIAGNVSIGNNCYIGAGSTIKNNLSIGGQSLIGSGANVVSSYANSLTLIGNPAKPK